GNRACAAPDRGVERDAYLLKLQKRDAGRFSNGWAEQSPLLQKVQSKHIIMKPENNNRKAARTFLEKIVIDAGVGRLSQTPNFEEKALVQVMSDLANMTGQKAEIRRAKKSIAGFKIREGQIVGLRVTLRREKMVDFFERLITIVLPRVRDFTGLEVRN